MWFARSCEGRTQTPEGRRPTCGDVPGPPRGQGRGSSLDWRPRTGQAHARYPGRGMTWAGRSSHCTTTATDDSRE